MVNDDRLLAEAVRDMLTGEGMEVSVVSEAADDALETARSLSPDLVLIDPAFGGAGIGLGRAILRELPRTRVLALTHARQGPTVDAVLDAGFHGCISTRVSLRQFVEAIRAASSGKVVVPSSHATGNGHPKTADLLANQLSPRERELLALLVEGASSGQIAERLSLSPNTVRTHIQSILTKLQVHSRLEAASFAFRHGIVKVLDAEG